MNSNDFIISLNDVYKWIGFSLKGDAKKILVKHFKENIDYKISLENLPKQSSNLQPIKGGKNKQLILLSINCFKKFCMKVSTNEADKIYDYYIKMEEIIFKYIEEKYKEQINIIQQNKQLLEIKDKTLEEKIK